MEPRYPETDGFQISNSSLETFLRCHNLHWLRQTIGRRVVTVPMAIGSAVAKAAMFDNMGKRGTHSPWSLPSLVDIAVNKYEEEVYNYEVQNAARFDIENSVDDVSNATIRYLQDISPQIKEPLLFEEAVLADLGDGLHLVGTPDCVEPGLVRDLKTGQPWDQRRVDRSRQFTAYDILYEAKYGKSPERIAVDSLSRPKKGGRLWGAKTIWSSRCERDRVAFVETARRARKAIEAGSDLPAPEGAWWCSESHCEMWNVCEVRPGA